jgi:poly(3-hydroxybutyrate) depolymerase
MMQFLRVDTGPLPHLVSVPAPRADAPTRWPVLFFLHGHDEGPPTELNAGLTRHGPLRATASPWARERFLVVAPQLPIRGDRWRHHAEAVRDVVREAWELHRGDPTRTYLTGFSFGANGVFDLGLGQPGLWAALWAVDPTRVPERDPGLPCWLSAGQASRPLERHFVERLGLETPPAGATPSTMGERVILDEQEDHVSTANLAYENETIYRWLELQHLARPVL